MDIYGKVLTFDGRSLNDCPFRFQGQYEDEETGLYYNRFRYYSHETGGYLSQDPIGLAGNNPTLYGYVIDVNFWIDVFGLDCSRNKKTSYQGRSRKDAFRQAKKDASIPMNQQYSRVEYEALLDENGKKMFDSNGMPIQTRNYIYDVSSNPHYKNTKIKEVVIQEHSIGHPKANVGDPATRPHFNVRPDYNTANGNVPNTHGHYNF